MGSSGWRSGSILGGVGEGGRKGFCLMYSSLSPRPEWGSKMGTTRLSGPFSSMHLLLLGEGFERGEEGRDEEDEWSELVDILVHDPVVLSDMCSIPVPPPVVWESVCIDSGISEGKCTNEDGLSAIMGVALLMGMTFMGMVLLMGVALLVGVALLMGVVAMASKLFCSVLTCKMAVSCLSGWRQVGERATSLCPFS